MAEGAHDPKPYAVLNARLEALAGLQAKVGWFESAKYEDGTPVAYVAAIQQSGYGPIPPRPFMNLTPAQEKQLREIAQDCSQRVIEGTMTPHDAMETLALVAEGFIAQNIADVTSPPLSPITIELRHMKQKDPDLVVTGATVGEAARRVKEPGYIPPSGVSTKPLNESGHMIATLTSVVEKTR